MSGCLVNVHRDELRGAQEVKTGTGIFNQASSRTSEKSDDVILRI